VNPSFCFSGQFNTIAAPLQLKLYIENIHFLLKR
jgi:hypothetical protein